MFAPWRSHNPVRITKCPITGKSFIVAWYTHPFSTTCCVALHAQLFDTVNGKSKSKSEEKETAIDSSCLKCHTLLALCSWKQGTEEGYWEQQICLMKREFRSDRSKWTTLRAGPKYSGRTKPKWSFPFNKIIYELLATNLVVNSYISSHVWYYFYTYCYMYHTLYFVNSVYVIS